MSEYTEARSEVATEMYLEECRAHRETLEAYKAMRAERDALADRLAAADANYDACYEDVRRLCRVLGLFDGARPVSAHVVFEECLDAVTGLTARLAEAERLLKVMRDVGTITIATHNGFDVRIDQKIWTDWQIRISKVLAEAT